ncbi:DUF262 domain-containing protein [Lacticaseibacillus nasuensis]|uniref:DUF262 domain-containing protein n=1 Tax=Lacticaseibacillus nasuensis TaxID=944671 RepID=UPI002246B104|nr:DUF262 domain-containing HNH endonuclease family protein [Lacticaseibacillus nasuensis]MCX2454949.1 DUF262 domain-containing HNH endonuclease family protein [Lacticaseibacillus nasuensis]
MQSYLFGGDQMSNGTNVKPTDNVLMDYFQGLNAHIPNYQRSYEWGIDQIDEFMEDLFAETERSADSRYFFGPVVTTNDDESHKQIIDGQQRLTTAVMLFAAIRNLLTKYGDDDEDARGIRGVIDLELIGGIDKYHKLTIVQTGDIKDDFHRTIQQLNSDQLDQHLIIYKGRNAKGKGKINRVHRAYNELLDKTQEYLKREGAISDKDRVKVLKKLFETFVNHFFVVEIWAPDRTDAFQIFQTINARGLDLSAADLIKSDFFGNSGSAQEKIASLWENVQQTLGDLDMSDFIRYVWNFGFTFSQKRSLYKSLSSEIRGQERILEFMELLDKLAKPYAEMNDDPDANFLNSDRDGKQALQIIQELNILGFKIYAPIYLAMVAKGYTNSEILEVLKAVRGVLARNKILGNSTNKLERLFAHIGNLLYKSNFDNPSAISSAVKELHSQEPKDSDVRANLEEYDFSTDLKTARFVLRTIENAEPTEKSFSNNLDVHVEHILPKNPKPDDLESWGFTQEQHDDNLWRIGNLTLWYGPTNSAAGNTSFQAKQREYQASDVGLTRELVHYTDWTVETINSRTNELIDRFLRAISE